ncbi:hypothetical protein HYX03_01475 [Candidatus Woesearchaeota archaeon]|nr:hypothetical protein [Candidatus Woesearchaeota archaeon]
MNKRGDNTFWVIVIIVLFLLVFVFVTPLEAKMRNLLKTGVGLGTIDRGDTNDKVSTNNQLPSTKTERETKGELSEIKVITVESSETPKPTSPDYCLAVTSVKNIGTATWIDSDKIKATLFCKHLKNQKSDLIYVQNYPYGRDYITNLKPGEQIQISFPKRFPDSCLKSSDDYYITLYSNCDGKGTEYEPCDNVGPDADTNPKVLSSKAFKCK